MSRATTYAAVWRWHFYAGLICIPFVVWLALTGTLYLWRPQIEGWLDRRYDAPPAATQASPAAQITAVQAPPNVPIPATQASPDAQVAAALATRPGSRLRQYILPEHPGQPARILVTRSGIASRVYVDPQTLAVRHVEAEEQRPFRILSRLHGELLAGTIGSYLVEIAACWAVTMLLTGLFLWWPRGRRGPGGVLYPRLRAGRRTMWRDLHAVSGLWVSVAALGLILTGLPWAKGWGSYLVEVRALTGTGKGPVDWTIGGRRPGDAAVGAHAGHHMASANPAPPPQPGALANVILTARRQRLAPPVLIAPPKSAGAPWTVSSDAANRPLRATLAVDGGTGRLLSRTDFAGRHWIDRVIGYGIAIHEGALFGLVNQLLGTLTALLLVLLAVSGAVLWWRRRPQGVLGAPMPTGTPRYTPALIVAIVALALYMPMFGLTLVIVVAIERLALRPWRRARRWLGLELRPGQGAPAIG